MSYRKEHKPRDYGMPPLPPMDLRPFPDDFIREFDLAGRRKSKERGRHRRKPSRPNRDAANQQISKRR